MSTRVTQLTLSFGLERLLQKSCFRAVEESRMYYLQWVDLAVISLEEEVMKVM